MNRLGLILFTIGALAARARADSFHQSAKTVDRFNYVEVTLTLDRPAKGNPFVDASLAGVLQHAVPSVRSPLTPPANVDGFCDRDDGRVFRIRFMPTVEGRYTYTVTFRNGASELKHSGEFTARTGKRRGMVLRDEEHPTHFTWSGSGDHFFYNSTTAYWLLGFKDDAVIRESIDRLDRLRVNRIRVALSGRTASGMRWKEPMIVRNDDFQFRLFKHFFR